jgi:multiple sugar transport system substrate-binding protein
MAHFAGRIPVFCCLLLWSGAVRASEIHLVSWRPDAPVWDELIADFERRSGVKVLREVGPASSSELHDLVVQKLKNHDAHVDVIFVDVIWPAEFAAAGWLAQLDALFPDAERSRFLPAPILAAGYGGHIYAVPVFIDAGILYYRKDLLAKYSLAPPRTWPELVDQAKMILGRERDRELAGFSGQFKQYEGLVCNLMEYIAGNGGDLWDEKEQASALHAPRAVDAVRFVRDRIVGEISHRGVLAYQEPESLAVFSQGKAIFHRNWPHAWGVANDPGKSKIAGKVGMKTLPVFPGGRSASALGGWQLAISRFSRQPELAWKFIAYMTGEEAQKRIALATGRAPTRKALYGDGEILRKQNHLSVQYETFTSAVPRPRTPVYAAMSNVMQRYFSSAIAVRDSDVGALARLASRDVDRLLSLVNERGEP